MRTVLNVSHVSWTGQASDRFKTGCFELLDMIHYSMIVVNISKEKPNEGEIQLR